GSWMLRNRWKRIAIGAAGMYIEVVLSAIAIYVWAFASDGLIKMLALNVFFVTTITTVIFNANPLMRFDGYYILSDLLEIPNLRQKATSALSRALASVFLGMPAQPDPFLPRRHRGLFALYAAASAIYRWVIVISILLMLMRAFRPYGLQILGQAMAAATIAGMIAAPLIKLRHFIKSPGRMRQVNKLRFACSSLLALALLYALAMMPLPHRVVCRVE